MRKTMLFFSVLAVLLTWKVFGQADSGTVVGTVTDPAGSVIPSATVTITNVATGLVRIATTNASGQYRADAFPTGPLTITVEQPGFQKLVRSGITLTAADILTLNLQLSVGNVQETVEVRAEAPLLQSETAAVSTLITNQQMLETPINGRDFAQLIVLSAGASPSTPGSILTGLTGFYSRSNNLISINGNTPENNLYLVDGLYNIGLWLQSVVMVPTIDSIQEQRLMANAYSAEYGGSAGAVTLVQTKSGSNSFHGNVYEFFRNGDMDANSFFNNASGLAKPIQKRNEYGGTLGGPIFKDKTFFFVDYQGINWSSPSTVTNSLPTAAQQQMVKTGNFSGFGQTIFDPLTSDANGNRLPFPGNIIPANRLNPMALNILSLLPPLTSSGATNNFVYNPVTVQSVRQGDGRIDQNFGASDRLFFKYSIDDSDATGACTLPPNPATAAQFNVNPACVTGGTFSDTMTNWSATANYTKIFSTTFIDEIRIGVLRNAFIDLNPDSGRDIATPLGNPSLDVQKTFNDGMPAIGVSGFITNPMIGSNSSNPETIHSVVFQYEDIASLNRGNHSIKFGAVYFRDRFNGHTSNFPRGTYDFNGQYTSQIGTTPTAGLADFALGATDAIERTEQFGYFGERRWRLGSFIQDEWRVNNRLTVTYGLRYELQAPFYEVFNRFSNLTPGGQIVLPTSNPCGRSTVCLDKTPFAPRLGIAYMLTKDQKTVFRAGSGVGYFWGINGGRQMVENAPMNVQQSFTTAANAPPTLYLTTPLPVPVAPNLADPTQLNLIWIAYDTHMKLAQNFQWSADIQRQLRNDLSLSVGYVGTRTNDMMNIVNPNQPVPGIGPEGPRRPLYTVNPAIPDISYRTNAFAAKYHSLQVNLDKRYAKGLTGHLAYTWSHNMSNTVSPNNIQSPVPNSNCTACDWGPVNEDRRNMLVISHVYELPFGAGRQFVNHGAMSYVVGGWDLSGLWTWYSGMHFDPVNGVSNISGTQYPGGTNYQRPNVVAGCNPNDVPGGATIQEWFNTACFTLPQLGTFGNSGAYTLLGPGLFTVDLGLHRNFRIKETIRLQVRWETFNTTNHANFDPGASAYTAPVNATGPGAGVITSTFSSRVMQLAMKLNF
jgi:hypothetical protein